MTPADFIAKWSASSLTERSSAQQHFLDLCDLLGVAKPADVDTKGDHYTFEKATAKESGQVGFADVWYQNHFAWEYKGPHNNNLDAALAQVRQYIGALGNPPILVVSDMQRFRIVSQFTNYVTTTREITIGELSNDQTRAWLKNLWLNPEALKPAQTRDAVTAEAARQFAQIADRLRVKDKTEPHRVAHFLIRILFCLFAENNRLLPPKHFTGMLERFRGTPEGFTRRIADIFAKMARGGLDGNEEIRYFNGDLFTNAEESIIRLHPDDLAILWNATAHDWSSIAPAIFGTLFERGLDPAKRSQIGAHYTSEADIMDVVEPVVMAPLRRQWDDARTRLEKIAGNNNLKAPEARRLLGSCLDAVSQMTVLDPACGSGNFLYVTLKLLHDLEFEIITWMVRHGLDQPFPTVGPHQLHGLEINTYAAELARAVIWIGHLQWMIEHGFDRGDPVLDKLDNIQNCDALIDPTTGAITTWPTTTCIVSNPPFLGGNRVRAELGDAYVETLWRAYDGRVGAFADLVCYFVEHANEHIRSGKTQRVGLITTNSIRGGVNRKVIDRIKSPHEIDNRQTDLFMAWADRPWVLDGAAVRISILAFDNGKEPSRTLDGNIVGAINSDLTSSVDLTKAKRLVENLGISFKGINKDGPFDIDNDLALQMLQAKGNPNGKPNSDVVKPYINAADKARRSRNKWIIDFGTMMSLEEAALYEVPFEYVKKIVYPIMSKNRRESYRTNWWRFPEARPGMRRAISPLSRYIVTPIHAKYRLFAWVDADVVPDHALFVFARDDDYTFGVLHSHAHELWSLRMGTSLGETPRYTPTTCFETFPFPRADAQQQATIGEAAQRLVQQRDIWLNPPDATESELKKRTLTTLYNARPQWLANAHAQLDLAFYAAYGWPADISDDAILEALLAENLTRAGAGTPIAAISPPEEIDDSDEDAESDE